MLKHVKLPALGFFCPPEVSAYFQRKVFKQGQQCEYQSLEKCMEILQHELPPRKMVQEWVILW